MKKNKLIYALGGLLAMSFASCELTEKPDSFYEKDTYFESESKAQMSVYGIHDCIGTQDHYGQFEMAMVASDDTYYIQGTSSDNTRRDLAHYMIKSTNTWVEGVWKYKYKGIDRANFTIAGITGMPDYEGNKNLKYMVAEAHFLRAFLAFDLVKHWGDVPYKTTYSSGYGEVFLPRTDREVIYEEIISDLDFAKENLRAGGDITNPEIPCQAAAHALLMRVYLYRAGYSLKMDGQLTRPDDATRKKYFDAVISEWTALQSKGYHGFYDGGFDKLFMDYSAGVLNNKESLWEIAFSSPAGEKDNASSYGIYLGPLVDEPSVKPTERDRFMGRANAFFRVVPEWLNFYEEKDVRRDVNICTYQFKWRANVYDHVQEESPEPLLWFPGKWRREWMPKGYLDLNNGSVNFCPIRYADAVLMAAEAYNETGNTTQAWALLNSVRTRAGATAITTANYSTLLKSPAVYDLPFIDDGDDAGRFRTALYWERAFEMCYENVRKLDLIRWGVLDKALKLFGDGIQNAKVKNNHYHAPKNFVKGQHELMPIPLSEMQSNPMLEGKNNPKY
ncbi:RagB/SusD family nutrient uptake outer membrane protein [Bacteroides sp. 51]|uniref:RagB/SusD family nutrient uptake outer membrane protein n=1 Tax=Bacteroides sp. 51 TaxID=2302938 RepID=UPI0013D634EA|nr:RagB/SusD family nutrient uptake outer membrane protein [Bacteroides sp. 51]NDV82144.1 RagB/SusD family nutrient uptake outer membrane protein [Bacteroides sp. 51]